MNRVLGSDRRYTGNAMNDGMRALPSASSRRHLEQTHGTGLTETTSADLRGGGVDVCKRRLPSVGRTDRDSGVAELEVCEGDQVKNPTPPPLGKTETTEEMVSGVWVVRGKRKNGSELRQKDSQGWCRMPCRSAYKEKID